VDRTPAPDTPTLLRHLLWLYLLWQDPWYSVLAEWDEKMEDEDEDEDEEEEEEEEVANKEGSKAEIEVLVKREGDASYSMVSWRLSNTYHVTLTRHVFMLTRHNLPTGRCPGASRCTTPTG
jgi:hypothetical protein